MGLLVIVAVNRVVGDGRFLAQEIRQLEAIYDDTDPHAPEQRTHKPNPPGHPAPGLPCVWSVDIGGAAAGGAVCGAVSALSMPA